jgi:hypothetical protein
MIHYLSYTVAEDSDRAVAFFTIEQSSSGMREARKACAEQDRLIPATHLSHRNV